MLDPWQVATGCIALLTGLMAWIGKRHIARLDRHDDKFAAQERELGQLMQTIVKLEASMLRKEDLTSMEARLMAAMAAQHTSNIERISRVEMTADKAHERLDVFARSRVEV